MNQCVWFLYKGIAKQVRRELSVFQEIATSANTNTYKFLSASVCF
jgi:hypothetical protein